VFEPSNMKIPMFGDESAILSGGIDASQGF
jgi:hypothetical protein